MKKYLGNEKGFFSLIGILLAVALLLFFVYYVINMYFGTSSRREGIIVPGGSDNAAGNYQSIIQSTKENVNKINTKTMEQLQQIDELKK